MDSGSATIMTFGIAFLLVSWIVLLIVAWQEDYAWGLCTLFIPPLAYLYALARLDKTGGSLGLAVAGWICLGLALG